MASLRKKRTENKYQEYLKNVPNDYCFLCNRDLLIKEYKYFILVKNRFPYDREFRIHNILATKRHITDELDMNVREWIELQRIKRNVRIGDKYSSIWENTLNGRSVPLHWHIHFLKF